MTSLTLNEFIKDWVPKRLGRIFCFRQSFIPGNVEIISISKLAITIFAMLDEQEYHEFAFLVVIPK